MNSWSSFSRYYTYVLLRDEDDQSVLKEQLPAIANTLVPDQERERYGFKLQCLSKINLGINLANCMPGTKHSFEYVFIPFLAVLVIFLACFNYIILSIARSLKRTKEIGIRKVLGASVSGMAYLLSKDYIKLILVSAVFCHAGRVFSVSICDAVLRLPARLESLGAACGSGLCFGPGFGHHRLSDSQSGSRKPNRDVEGRMRPWPSCELYPGSWR